MCFWELNGRCLSWFILCVSRFCLKVCFGFNENVTSSRGCCENSYPFWGSINNSSSSIIHYSTLQEKEGKFPCFFVTSRRFIIKGADAIMWFFLEVNTRSLFLWFILYHILFEIVFWFCWKCHQLLWLLWYCISSCRQSWHYS